MRRPKQPGVTLTDFKLRPLIARTVFFGNPDRAGVRISPDGRQISWLAPLDGVLNLWVAPRDDLASARCVTKDTARGIRHHLWAYTSNHILYLQDRNGDENWRLYAVQLDSGSVLDLTPFEGVLATINTVSPQFPDEIVVGLNNRDPKWHDIYRVNINTGELTLLLKHDRFSEVIVDDEYRVRFAAQLTSSGGADLYAHANGDWTLWDTIPAADDLNTAIIGFDKTNQFVLMKDSRGRDTSALIEVDAQSKATRVLASDLRTDAIDVLCHPTEKHVQAVSFIHQRKRWEILDPAIGPDIDFLRSVADGDAEITSRSLDDRFWVVAYLVDDGPVRFHLYDRQNKTAAFLFTARKDLENLPLAKMVPAMVRSRDGLDLVAYYTLPVGSDKDADGIPDRPLPTVFIPHGGPWSRDYWGFSSKHQWLANRGYAVLSVNFRASTGFGKSFVNAGDREWGGKIIEDQLDTVQWAIQQGIADPNRVAVMGGSFGGFSALAGLTFTPEFFACGVDIVGVANLITWIESIPSYWKPMLDMFIARIGDPRTEEGRALLRKQSPLTYVDRICRPLLVAQGANDPRVRQAESDQIVQAMTARAIPVTYVLYPDEGHGFARPENNLSFHALAEGFLATHLGGRAEPIGDDCKGSSLKVPNGAEQIPGLREALPE
jgi:dipeptidyl aminopeptidase/acylaminoacyl peptidase